MSIRYLSNENSFYHKLISDQFNVMGANAYAPGNKPNDEQIVESSFYWEVSSKMCQTTVMDFTFVLWRILISAG